MLENRILNITSDDVLKENDLDVLISWRRTLLHAINDMKARLHVINREMEEDNSEDLKSKYIRTSDARNHNIAFVDAINLQIREIRGTKINRGAVTKFKAKEYIQYLKTFRALVKSVVDEELFESLNKQAKELSGWNNDSK